MFLTLCPSDIALTGRAQYLKAAGCCNLEATCHPHRHVGLQLLLQDLCNMSQSLMAHCASVLRIGVSQTASSGLAWRLDVYDSREQHTYATA